MVNVPLYAQRDPAWGDLELGTSGLLVKDDGCTSVCAASCLGVDPINFISKMNANAGFTPGGLLRWTTAASLFDGQWINQQWGLSPADLNWITNLIAKGYPVILETRFPGNYSDAERNKVDHMHFLVCVDTDLTIQDPWFGDTIKFADRYGDPARWIYSADCFQKLPGSTDYMGHPQEYWLQVEKDRSDLFKQVGDLTTQVHEFSTQLDAEKVKSQTLLDQYNNFLSTVSTQLNVPPKPEEVTKAIAEVMSVNDSIDKLNQQITMLKQSLATALGNSSMFQSEAKDLTLKLNTTQGVLTKTSTDLQKVSNAYSQLLMQTGGTPFIEFILFGNTFKWYKKGA
jgi:regulator of replication initiation timing